MSTNTDTASAAGTRSEVVRLRERVAELEARERRFRRYETAFHASPVGVHISTLEDGRILELNEAAARRIGYSGEECVGMEAPSRLWAEPDDRTRLVAELRREGRVRRYPLRVRRRDGEILELELSGELIEVDGEACLLAITQDVTERNRYARDLRTTEVRYRAVVDTQTEFILRRLPDGTLTFANEAYCRWFGCAPDDLPGRDFWSVVAPSDVERVRRQTASLCAERPAAVGRYRVVRGDDSVRWLEWVERGLFGDDGRLREIQAVGRDVTALMVTHEALRASEARLRATLAALPDLVLRHDAAGVLREVHAPVGGDAGLVPGSRPGANVRDLLPAPIADRWRSVLRSVVETGRMQAFEYELEVEGRLRRFEARTVRSGSDEALSIIRDVTAWKEEEEARAASDRRFRAFFEQIAAAAAAVGLDGVITTVNPAFEELIGRTADELLGTSVYDYMGPTTRTVARAMVDELQEGGLERRWREAVLLRDGEPVSVDCCVSLVRDELDEPDYLIGIAHDISERKQLERELKDVAAQERRRLGRDLHDGLGQQLTGACLLAKALERRLQAAGSPGVQALREIEDVIQGALAETRYLAKGLYPMPLSVTIADALRDLADNATQLYGVPVRVEVQGSVELPEAERVMHVYQICREAVTNAVRHGGASHIEIRLRRLPHEFRLAVEDNGVGISPEPERLEGIGMRSMRFRARQLGGELVARRRNGPGTTIELTVPLAEPEGSGGTGGDR